MSIEVKGKTGKGHYRHWLNNHDANLVHITGTHFATEWMGGSFIPVLKAGFELVTIRVPISCSTN